MILDSLFITRARTDFPPPTLRHGHAFPPNSYSHNFSWYCSYSIYPFSPCPTVARGAMNNTFSVVLIMGGPPSPPLSFFKVGQAHTPFPFGRSALPLFRVSD